MGNKAELDRRRLVAAPQSKRIRRSFSTSLTETSAETSYISQSHLPVAPGTTLPLLFVNQNLVVMSGSTRAWNTSPGDRRMSIPTFTDGICVS
jgi:hypothetical protein